MAFHSISVIIPVYNGEAFLKEAIQSIQQQNYQPLEIIVVDDGSTDRTAEIANSYGNLVRYAYQSNRGPAAARNKGLGMAHGNIIAFLDADDLWTPNKLEIQIPYLKSNVSEIVLGRVQVKALEGEPLFKIHTNPILSFVMGCGLFRKSVFDKVGYFDENLRYSEDIDWYLRVREHNIAIAVLSEVTLFHRKHRNNTTRRKTAHDLNMITVLRKSLARRRAKQPSVTSLPDLIHVNPKVSQESTSDELCGCFSQCDYSNF